MQVGPTSRTGQALSPPLVDAVLVEEMAARRSPGHRVLHVHETDHAFLVILVDRPISLVKLGGHGGFEGADVVNGRCGLGHEAAHPPLHDLPAYRKGDAEEQGGGYGGYHDELCQIITLHVVELVKVVRYVHLTGLQARVGSPQFHDQSYQFPVSLDLIRKDDVLRHHALLVLQLEGVLLILSVGTQRPVLVLEVDVREEKRVGFGLDRAEEDLHVEESGLVEGDEEVAYRRSEVCR